jgi:hypothetical protein
VAPNAGVEDWYMKELARLTDAMRETALREIEKLFRAEGGNLGYSEDASLSSQARITMNGLRRLFARLFAKKGDDLADGMLAKASGANAARVKASLKELSGGLAIKTDFISGRLYAVIPNKITCCFFGKDDYDFFMENIGSFVAENYDDPRRITPELLEFSDAGIRPICT